VQVLFAPVEGSPLRSAGHLVDSIVGGRTRGVKIVSNSLFVEFYVDPPTRLHDWTRHFQEGSIVFVGGAAVGLLIVGRVSSD